MVRRCHQGRFLVRPRARYCHVVDFQMTSLRRRQLALDAIVHEIPPMHLVAAAFLFHFVVMTEKMNRRRHHQLRSTCVWCAMQMFLF